MLKSLLQTCLAMMAVSLMPAMSSAVSISPEIGSQTPLSTLAHNVSGTATIVDEDTIRFDDFTYDGGASYVYFFLGTVESEAGFISGLKIGSLLSGHAYDGTQGPIFIDLPIGETIDGYHAISVWCERFDANFGSGTFQPVPEPAGIVLLAVGVLGISTRRRR